MDATNQASEDGQANEAYLVALEAQVDKLLDAASGDQNDALILAAATILDLAKNVSYGLTRRAVLGRISPPSAPPPVIDGGKP